MKTAAKCKGVTENFLAGAVGDPFQRIQFRAKADPPSLPQKFFGGKLKLKLLPRAVLEIPLSDFHFLTYFGSEWTP